MAPRLAVWLRRGQRALLGFGERTGNTPIEALIIEYISFKGHNDGIDTRYHRHARYFEKELNYQIPSNYPCGQRFQRHQCRYPCDGVLKNPEIYNIFDTDKILRRPIT